MNKILSKFTNKGQHFGAFSISLILILCRKNGVPGTESRSQPHQSHLMDLLDISLGATSISSPPQNSDPWGMPVTETNKVIIFNEILNQSELQIFVVSYVTQISDPWRSSPAIDPWNTNTGAISKPPMSSLAANPDNWVPRAQSAASASSNDSWMPGNNAASIPASSNGNLPPTTTNDPWLTKPPSIHNDGWKMANSKPAVVDPWAPVSNNMGARPSPIGAQVSPNSDYDEFDVISNRAKTQNANNNNTSNSKSIPNTFRFK